MDENKDCLTDVTKTDGTVRKTDGLKRILTKAAAGFAMGIAFIIPGFSGGSVAAILGIYEELISAIAELPRKPVKSIKALLPIMIGLALGAVSLLYPLGWALEVFPLPTVSLFVGLAIGGMPSVTDRIKGRPSLKNLIAFIIPLLAAVALSFAPTGADVNLFNLTLGGYLLLFLVGVLGSAALVVPGISGSMLLLILGYYNPIIKLLTEHFLKGQDVLVSLLVLGSCGLGIVLGFFLISLIMKALLERCPRGTYFAIVGFILGSIPTVFVSTAKDAGLTPATLPREPLYWIVCALLLLVGGAVAYTFCRLAKKRIG